MAARVAVRGVSASAITSGTVQTFEVPGFGIPKAAFLFVNLVEVNITPVADAVLSMGLTDGVRQFCAASSIDDNTGSSVASHRTSNTSCICLLKADDRTVEAEAVFRRWTANGIEIEWVNLPATPVLVRVVLFNGTHFSLYAGDWTGSASDIVITAPNFPVDQLFWIGARNQVYDSTDDGGGNPLARWMMGFADRIGTVNCSLAMDDVDNAPVSTPANFVRDGTGGEGEIPAYSAQGFTVKGNADFSGFKYFYLAMGFAGAVNHWVGIIHTKTSAGDQTHTEPGIRPQFVMQLVSPIDAVNVFRLGDALGAGSFGIGLFTASEAFTAVVTHRAGITPMDTESYTQARPGVSRKGSKAITFTLAYVSMEDLGWTVTYSATDATSRKWPGLVIGESIPPTVRTLGKGIFLGKGITL